MIIRYLMSKYYFPENAYRTISGLFLTKYNQLERTKLALVMLKLKFLC